MTKYLEMEATVNVESESILESRKTEEKDYEK